MHPVMLSIRVAQRTRDGTAVAAFHPGPDRVSGVATSPACFEKRLLRGQVSLVPANLVTRPEVRKGVPGVT